MKIKKFKDLIPKLSAFLFILCLVFMFETQAKAQVHDLNMNSDSEKPELQDEGSSAKVKNIPHSNITSDNVPLVSDAKVQSINETISGLKEAGYTLDEIVSVLKNDNYNAPKISIACLKAGYNGTKIFDALKKNGFSERSAEAAVPVALRTSAQPFVVYSADPNSVEAEMALIDPNPFSSGVIASNAQDGSAKAAIQEESKAGKADVNPLEVPVSVGVTFNGLGNWNAFQDERFNSTLK